MFTCCSYGKTNICTKGLFNFFFNIAQNLLRSRYFRRSRNSYSGLRDALEEECPENTLLVVKICCFCYVRLVINFIAKKLSRNSRIVSMYKVKDVVLL